MDVLETLKIIITAETKDIEKATKGIKNSFNEINKKSALIATAVVGATAAAGAALFGFAKKTADTASAIDDTSKKVGMSAEEYQKWAFAAAQSGLEVGKLESLMKKQQTVFSDAIAGSETAAKAYKDLGINISGMTASGGFDAVIAKLADMKDITERNRIANDIFGKSYADLAPLLAEGASGIEELRQKAVDLGGVMSNEAVASGENFGDTLDQLTTVVNGLWNEIGTYLIPIFQKIADWILENKETIFEKFEQVMTAIGNAVKWVSENSNWLIPVLSTLVGVFIALQIAMAAYNAAIAIQNILLAANPIGIIILAVVALVAAITALWLNWDKITKWMGETFKGFGNGVIGVVNKIIEGINLMIKWALSPINDLIKNWNKTVGKVTGQIPEISINIKAIPKLAKGGLLNAGQAFIAGEAGAELMGSYKGKTTVMPLENSGFVEAMKQAMIEGLTEAIGTNGGSTTLVVDGMVLAKSVEKNFNKLATVNGGLSFNQ